MLLLLCTVLANDLKNNEKNVTNFKFNVPFENIKKSFAKEKHILFWTPLKDSLYWNMGAKVQGVDYLKSIDCPVTNCFFSHDWNLLPKQTDYDAVVFNVENFISIDNLPSARTEEHIYIMASEE